MSSCKRYARHTDGTNFSTEQSRLLCELVQDHPCLYDLKHPLYKDVRARDNVWDQIGTIMELPGDICKNRWKNIKDTYSRNKRDRNVSTGSSASSKPSKWILYDYVSFLKKFDYEKSSYCSIRRPETTQNKSSDNLTVEPEVSTDVDGTPAGNASHLEPSHHDIMPATPTEARAQPLMRKKSVSISPSSDEDKENFSPPNGPLSITSKARGQAQKRKSSETEEKLFQLLEKRQQDRDRAFQELSRSQRSGDIDETDQFFLSMSKSAKKFSPLLLAEAKKKICTVMMDLEIENFKKQESEKGEMNCRKRVEEEERRRRQDEVEQLRKREEEERSRKEEAERREREEEEERIEREEEEERRVRVERRNREELRKKRNDTKEKSYPIPNRYEPTTSPSNDDDQDRTEHPWQSEDMFKTQSPVHVSSADSQHATYFEMPPVDATQYSQVIHFDDF